MSRTASQADLSLPAHFAMIVVALGRALYQHGRRDCAISPICSRLWSMARDFHNLFRLWAMGQLPATRQRPHQDPQPKPASDRPKPPPPLGFAWLVNILPAATDYRAQLQALLAQPTMMAFLAEVPKAGKMLRPLCRLLDLQLPPQPAQPQNPNPSAPPLETAPPESAPSETPPPDIAPPDIAPPDIAPPDIAPQEPAAAPIAPDQEQATAANACATPPQILPPIA